MKKYKGHLTRYERAVAYGMRANGKSLREIGEALGRDKSVLSREFRRNKCNKPKARWMTALEKASEAHDKAKRRRSDCKRGRRGSLRKAAVRKHVEEQLKTTGASPEAIAAELPSFLPGESTTGKTIRRWLKTDGRGLIPCLRERGKTRRSKVTENRSSKQGAPEKKSIDSRPAVVEAHTEAGHYEYDLITCSQSTVSILTIRELKTRHLSLMLVPNREADTVNAALAAHFSQIPKALLKTATNDNGSEFAHAYQLELRYGLAVYYCHPYSAWERGSVENGNKLVRWYVPKGTDLSTVTWTQLKEIELKINSRAMLCLGWKRPLNVYQEELRCAVEQEKVGAALKLAA